LGKKRIFLKQFRISIVVIITFMIVWLSGCDNSGIIHSPLSELWLAPMAYDDTGATTRLGVATVCLEVASSPADNQAKMLDFVNQIAEVHSDVQLILFGETSLGYYYRPGNANAYQLSVAETIPGPTTNLLSAAAIAHQTYISFGLSEIENGLLYNSQVLIGPDGEIVSVYRKINMTDWDIENGFTPGLDVICDTIGGVKVVTIICYDSMSAEINRRVFQLGAQVVLLSMADTVDETFLHYMPDSMRNGAWYINANRVGVEDGNTYDGHISICAPSGEIRKKNSKKEGYIYCEVGIW
jgi:predicted amidohydrolase